MHNLVFHHQIKKKGSRSVCYFRVIDFSRMKTKKKEEKQQKKRQFLPNSLFLFSLSLSFALVRLVKYQILRWTTV